MISERLLSHTNLTSVCQEAHAYNHNLISLNRKEATMGIDNVMKFLWTHAPNTVTEPMSLGVSYPNAHVFVDAFPWFWRCWCSLFGGVNDVNARQVQFAVQFFGEIVDQWLDQYGFRITFVLDPNLVSSLKQPERTRRRAERARSQRRTRDDIQRLANGTLNIQRRRTLAGRAVAQGFGRGRQGLDTYLEKRRRQVRTMGVTAVRGFIQVIQQRRNVRMVYSPAHVEGEMWCCRLADQEVLLEQRKPLSQRVSVLVITPDSDVLAYRSDYRVSRGAGWVWVSNVLPNVNNPKNGQYDFEQWWNDPSSDTSGIWRAIRPNAVRRRLRLTVAQMTDFAILCKNTIRQTDLKGMSCTKAYDLIRRYRNLEGLNRNLNALPRSRTNQNAWSWIYTNRRRLRSFWTSTPVP